ncbi:cytochrome P450 [Bombardia bombarda]|uniref:Cytochrome P450 n=1 Tax=Bombardia bombarda TaxID=252184 RepID=A0AA39TR44_9PEZI|nr:cytochrome P450 [Bombardia bombarda]
MELFVQVGYDALDTGDGGIGGENDPARHREIAKKLAPTFSMKNFRAKEAAIQTHIDLFVQRMKEHGGGEKGVDMESWSDWLGLDLSADLTYSLDMSQMRDMKSSVLLINCLKLNLFATLSQITRKIRLLTPVMYLCIPPSVLLAMPKLIKMNKQDVMLRIERQGKTEHLDYFEQLVPADKPAPVDKKEIYHLQNVSGQVMIAGWQPVANQYYSLLLFLLGEPDAYAALVDEIRTGFADYDDIKIETVTNLKYLNACAQESLRPHSATADGLPRVGLFAAARHPRYFTDPLKFRPERWLSPDHPRYDPRYKDDSLKASKPFSQEPRGCPGAVIASVVIRLFVAKVLWGFDLEAVAGRNGLPVFERDFTVMAFWKLPPFYVRFKPVERK